MHYKVDYIKALAVGFAVGAKTICSMRFVVHLHTWGLVIVERTVQPQLLIGFQVIVV